MGARAARADACARFVDGIATTPHAVFFASAKSIRDAHDTAIKKSH